MTKTVRSHCSIKSALRAWPAPQAAEILKAECESFGLSAVIEPFEIESAEVEATFEILEPYRKSYTVRGYQCAESTAADGLTADFVYVENALPVDLCSSTAFCACRCTAA